jgi:RNA polymerase sigma-70 factor (ECF subfamily)
VQFSAALVAAHQASVWRHLRCCGAAPDVADDLTQETFVRLWRSPPQDRGPAALAAWLRQTARNLLRNRRRDERVDLPFDDHAIEAAWAQMARDDDGASYREALARCLALLPPREREALRLRYESGGSRAAVAKVLGLQDEGAKTFLRRARARLLACVERRIGEGNEESRGEEP